MVDLVRSGRTPEELAREFEPTAQSISTWVKQAERDDAGKRVDGPTSAEREELEGLRRENHRLRQERAGHITRRLRAVTLTQSSCHYQENLDLIARKQEGGPKAAPPPARGRLCVDGPGGPLAAFKPFRRRGSGRAARPSQVGRCEPRVRREQSKRPLPLCSTARRSLIPPLYVRSK